MAGPEERPARMGAGGLEPPQSCDLRILSPLRLPFRHAPAVTATPFGDLSLHGLHIFVQIVQTQSPLQRGG